MSNTEFYERNANAFYSDTVTTDMTPIYARFLPLVEPGGRILDAGCGSGRDSLAFLQRGYQVDAFDGSNKMARRASVLTGIEVKRLTFESLLHTPLQEKYDGIWCCASFIHVEREGLWAVTRALCQVLAPGGIMYLSFKYGPTDRVKGGRRFTDLTEQGLKEIVAMIGGCKLSDCWVTNDQRPSRSDKWLNAIVQNF